jgi:RNA polymerase sigma-70 factor, ECF subfamily
MHAASPSPEARNEEFMRLFIAYQRRIHAFIATLLPNLADAEDVLQETSVTAWRKFDEFRSGTDFVRWACTIARFEVLKFRRQQRFGRLLFSDALVESLAEQQISQSDVWESWNQALAGCLARLRPADRALFLRCSASNATAKQVAAQLGRPANTVYKALGRICRALIECIERTVSREERER